MRKVSRSRVKVASGFLAIAALLGTTAAVAASAPQFKAGGAPVAGQWAGAQPGYISGGAHPDSHYAG